MKPDSEPSDASGADAKRRDVDGRDSANEVAGTGAASGGIDGSGECAGVDALLGAPDEKVAEEGTMEADTLWKEIRREANEALTRRFSEEIGCDSDEYPGSALDQDAYGVGIMCIVQGCDSYSRLGESASVVQRVQGGFTACFGIAILLMNGCMQLFLIIYTRKFVLHSLAEDMRHIYAEYHVKAFTKDGVFSYELWKTWDPAMQKTLCQFPLAQPVFFFTILLLWTLLIGGDLRSCGRLAWDVSALPTKMPGVGLTQLSGGMNVIIGIRPGPRWAIYVCAVLPKFMIACITWWYGCRWLLSTPAFADLILNSCALGFILGIDEILYAAIVPEPVRIQLQTTAIHTPRLKAESMQRQWKEIEFLTYISAVLYFLFGVLLTFLYIFKLQRVLPDFQWDIDEGCDH